MKISSRRVCLGATLMAISVIGFLILLIIYLATASINYKYAVAIDSGSTHSRVILFRWKADKLNNTGMIEEVKSCKVKSGIASFMDTNLDYVTHELLHCVHNVSLGLADQHLPIYLGATAGMRMLNMTKPDVAAKILAKIQHDFAVAGLKSKTTIISGKQEGLFAWAAANYLSGTLFRQWYDKIVNQTYGILDMGGASVQIAYPANISDHQTTTKNEANLAEIELFGKDFHISTFSNLCFGIEQAMNRYLKLLILRHYQKYSTSVSDDHKVIQVDCFPKSFETTTANHSIYNNICTKLKGKSDLILNQQMIQYRFVGTGHTEKCPQTIDELLDRKSCQANFEVCFETIEDDQKNPFYAISAYYHATKVLRLNKTENISKQQYLDECNNVCSMNKTELIQNFQTIPSKYKSSLCFKLSYIVSTLIKLYKFDDHNWPQLKFVNHINDSYTGWITGFMLNETRMVPSEDATISLVDCKFYYLMILSLFLLFLVSILILGQRSSRTNNNPRTSESSYKSQLQLNSSFV